MCGGASADQWQKLHERSVASFEEIRILIIDRTEVKFRFSQTLAQLLYFCDVTTPLQSQWQNRIAIAREGVVVVVEGKRAGAWGVPRSRCASW